MAKVVETKSSIIAAQLEEDILAKKYPAGGNLPSQQELAEMFGASSRSIREAFKAWKPKASSKSNKDEERKFRPTASRGLWKPSPVQ